MLFSHAKSGLYSRALISFGVLPLFFLVTGGAWAGKNDPDLLKDYIAVSCIEKVYARAGIKIPQPLGEQTQSWAYVEMTSYSPEIYDRLNTLISKFSADVSPISALMKCVKLPRKREFQAVISKASKTGKLTH